MIIEEFVSNIPPPDQKMNNDDGRPEDTQIAAANACIQELMKREDVRQMEVAYLKAEVELLRSDLAKRDEELRRTRFVQQMLLKKNTDAAAQIQRALATLLLQQEAPALSSSAMVQDEAAAAPATPIAPARSPERRNLLSPIAAAAAGMAAAALAEAAQETTTTTSSGNDSSGVLLQTVVEGPNEGANDPNDDDKNNDEEVDPGVILPGEKERLEVVSTLFQPNGRPDDSNDEDRNAADANGSPAKKQPSEMVATLSEPEVNEEANGSGSSAQSSPSSSSSSSQQAKMWREGSSPSKSSSSHGSSNDNDNDRGNGRADTSQEEDASGDDRSPLSWDKPSPELAAALAAAAARIEVVASSNDARDVDDTLQVSGNAVGESPLSPSTAAVAPASPDPPPAAPVPPVAVPPVAPPPPAAPCADDVMIAGDEATTLNDGTEGGRDVTQQQRRDAPTIILDGGTDNRGGGFVAESGRDDGTGLHEASPETQAAISAPPSKSSPPTDFWARIGVA